MDDIKNIREQFKMYNSHSYRCRLLKNIIFTLLENRILTHDEKRKQYYEFMAAYYSVDHECANCAEDRLEQNLIKLIENAFVDAMNKEELTESEKEKFMKEQYLRLLQYNQTVKENIGKDVDWSSVFK